MSYLDQEMTKLRLESLIRCNEGMIEYIRHNVRLMRRQMVSVMRANAVLEQQLEALHDADHLERVTGTPVVAQTRGSGRRKAA